MTNKRFSDYEKNRRARGSRGFMAQLKTYGPFRANDGIIFGVAKGLANYFGWSVGIVRILIIVISFFLFFWPTIILYLLAAMIMSPEPPACLNSQEERDIWLYADLDPEAAMNQLGRRASLVENRLRRLEDYVTSKEYKWERKSKGLV